MPKIQITTEGTWDTTVVNIDGKEVKNLHGVNLFGRAKNPKDDFDNSFMEASWATMEQAEGVQKQTVFRITKDSEGNLHVDSAVVPIFKLDDLSNKAKSQWLLHQMPAEIIEAMNLQPGEKLLTDATFKEWNESNKK